MQIGAPYIAPYIETILGKQAMVLRQERITRRSHSLFLAKATSLDFQSKQAANLITLCLDIYSHKFIAYFDRHMAPKQTLRAAHLSKTFAKTAIVIKEIAANPK